MKSLSVRVRFAPSPTGFVHIGGLRTALYNYLFAKANQGTYLLRIEDTDQERYVEGALENMLTSLEWAGIFHDEGVVLEKGQVAEKGSKGPYIQSQRLSIYQEHLKTLLESGHAYPCFCSKERLDAVREEEKKKKGTPRYDGYCRELAETDVAERIDKGDPYVVRLKLPKSTEISFHDLIRGNVSMNTDDMDDQVLMKSDGYPTYHFAVVVDDHLMEISHVIRGEEWLSSTPKHIYLYQVMGWEAPIHVHLPNILNDDRKKLSKRHGDVAAEDFRRKGYLPEALVNYIALLGWSPSENKERFSLEELEECFSLERVSKSGGIFDVKKLNWLSSQYIREADLERVASIAIPHLVEANLISESEIEQKKDWINNLTAVLRENIDHLSEMPSKAAVFFQDELQVEEGEAGEWYSSEELKMLKEPLIAALSDIEEWTGESIKKVLKPVQKDVGLKGPKFFKPLRVAVTGSVHGPDLMLVLQVLGKEKTLKRLEKIPV